MTSLGVRSERIVSQRKNTARTKVFALSVATLAVAIVVGLKVRGQSSPPCSSAFVPMLQNGIGAQAPCPASLSSIAPNVSNLSLFIQYRCGFVISPSTQQRLAQLEQESWPGQNNGGEVRLTRQQVKSIITAEFQSVSASLTDTQISLISNNTFRTMSAWTPSNRVNGVDLTSSYASDLSRATFLQDLQQLRGGDAAMQSLATAQLSTAIDGFCNVMAYVLPDWNVTYYSPYHVFVIAYNLASNDQLAGSYADCENRMSQMGTWLAQQGYAAPPSNAVLWGDAGCLYSRPVSIIFSDGVQSDLLSRYAAVHNLN
jgi:hypothetical protein